MIHLVFFNLHPLKMKLLISIETDYPLREQVPLNLCSIGFGSSKENTIVFSLHFFDKRIFNKISFDQFIIIFKMYL